MGEDVQVIAYARESSEDAEKAPPIENQIEIIKKEIEALGKNKGKEFRLIKIYADKGWSGGDWRRPDWNLMLKDLPRIRPKIIFFFSDDRLARDTRMFLYLADEFKKSKVELYDVMKHNFTDMETASGRFSNTLLAASHEYLRLTTSDKVKRLYQHRKEEADKAGKKVVWGRDPIPKEIADQSCELRKQGLSLSQICAVLPRYTLKRKGAAGQAITKQVSRAWLMSVFRNRGLVSERRFPPSNYEKGLADHKEIISEQPKQPEQAAESPEKVAPDTARAQECAPEFLHSVPQGAQEPRASVSKIMQEALQTYPVPPSAPLVVSVRAQPQTDSISIVVKDIALTPALPPAPFTPPTAREQQATAALVKPKPKEEGSQG